ncbi:MAG: amidohydrolase family protein [Verrucomicrobiales bacterium]|nr:amidohydrolase family protein [Verrucomicrobiales bacterium]
MFPSLGSGGHWIIDPHTHFKGEAQIAVEQEGKAPDSRNSLARVVTPDDYRALAERLEIQSTLVVEAVDQDRPDFNDWVLSEGKASDLVCGYIARGDLNSDDFLMHYERYQKTGYLNGYRFRREELNGYLSSETARAHLSRLERDGMVIDLLVDPSHAPDVIQLAREYPKLSIVINHCFRARMVDGSIDDEWKEAVAACAGFPNVFMKISSILNFAGTKPFTETAPGEMAYYLPVLKPCFDAFGEDRVIFATNWGVSAHYGEVDDVVRIVSEFLKTQSESALRKGMRENALRVYGIPEKNLR